MPRLSGLSAATGFFSASPQSFLFGGRNEHLITLFDVVHFCVMRGNSSTLSRSLA
ncbi:hypothetical protein COPR103792_09135 [Corynebacterium propinquum]